MKSFEPIYKELEDLFIHKLPDYIEKTNKEHNDGIILKRFENRKLDEDCLKHPCFKFSQNQTEYSEKDRIIENEVFKISFEIMVNEFNDNKIPIIWRYVEAIQKMLNEYLQEENINHLSIQIRNIIMNRIELKIIA